MFPPCADAKDSFSPQSAANTRPDETPTGDSPKPAQDPVPSAIILELRPRAINLPVQRPEDEGLSPWKAKSKREETSELIKAAVAYCCSMATAEAGYIADHTCNGVFAGYGGIIGDKHMRAADRSLRKLVKLMNGATDLMTVELWSLASVSVFIMNKGKEPGEEIESEEMEFLQSFARLTERICKVQYDREIKAVQP